MAFLNQWVSNYLFVILALILLIVIINFVSMLIVQKSQKKYRNLLRGSEGKDLETILVKLNDKVILTAVEVHKLTEEFTSGKVLAEKHLQKWSLLRFKAFENTGGDQSFALALLDADGDGVVISSIFGREESRVYCKAVQGGVSNYPLSAEEKEAINRAIGIGKK